MYDVHNENGQSADDWQRDHNLDTEAAHAVYGEYLDAGGNTVILRGPWYRELGDLTVECETYRDGEPVESGRMSVSFVHTLHRVEDE